MAEKLIQCKVCGKEVSSKANTCPNCGAKIKKKKGPFIAIALILLLIVVGAGMCGGSSQEDIKDSYSVGEVATVNDVSVVFDGVTESNGSLYNEPTDGNVFVFCEFTIENNSDEEINISSLLCFEAYVDGYAVNYSLGAQVEAADKTQLDVTIAPGKKANGVVGYEISEDWSEIEIQFTPQFWNGTELTFVANK